MASIINLIVNVDGIYLNVFKKENQLADAQKENLPIVCQLDTSL
jgi:hypothetical protein